MPSMSTRAKCSIPTTNPNPTIGLGSPNASIYEKCREDRIKENLARMQNLGILDLSVKLKSEIRTVKRPYRRSTSDSARQSPGATPPPPQQLSLSTRRSSRSKKEAPVARRSSRLKDVTPVTYSEEPEAKRGKASKQESLWLEQGERPEIYTEEHEKLLGNTERVWELFVDGCDKDGKRIYDPVRGKTCHQCRQKTMGYRTECSQCNPSVQGQFCGDCLYMRYGEHVLEALENPEWVCPVCRGICNCSLCRKHKGWFPTGAAYRKICKLGYKSVAHYLIHTNKQSETSEEDETDATANNQASAKRALSFKEAKASSEELGADDDDTNKNPDSARKSLSFVSSAENHQTSLMIDVPVQGDLNSMDPGTPEIIDLEAQCNETAKRSSSKRKMSVEPSPNSIGGRLRQRRKSQG